MSDRSHIASDSTEISPRSTTSLAPAAIAALVNSIMLASTATAQGSDATMVLASADTMNLDTLTVESGREKPLSNPKLNQPLVDTPQTIAVVPHEVFAAQGATTLTDVLRNTPGITFAAGEGGGVASGDSFYMRGFDATSSIFIDGVRDNGTYNRDVYNIEQVEIAKGPAGADNGRGGSSGYVNIATKSPQQGDSFVRSELTYGDAEDGKSQQRATLDINRPVNDTVGFRLNAMWQDSGTPGRDVVNSRAFGVAPSLALQLGESSRIVFSGAREEQDGLPDSGLPIVALPGFAGNDVDQSNFYGLASHGFEAIDNTRLGVRLETPVGDSLKATAQIRYLDTERDMLITRPTNSAAAAYDPVTKQVTPTSSRLPEDYKTLAYLLNFNGKLHTGSLQHDLSFGAEVTDEARDTETWTNGAALSTDLFNPDPYRVATPAQLPSRASNNPYTSGQVDTRALYAFDTIAITPRWLLNLSIRWEDYDVEYESLAASTTAVPNPELTRLSTSGDIFSYKTGLVFKPASTGSLYVAFANSQTPPGSGFTLSSAATNANNPELDPQEATNLEAGVKWEFFQKRLSTSLAFYRSENKNTPSIDAVTNERTQNISQTSEGVELGLSGRITGEWLVYGGLGFIDTTYNSAGTTASANDGAGLRFTPRLSGNVWTTYALARRLTIGGGLQYTDSVARSTSNTTSSTATSLSDIPSSTLVNLMAAYAINERVTLRLNINNLFDEESFRLNNNGGRYYPGTPRAFLLTASLNL